MYVILLQSLSHKIFQVEYTLLVVEALHPISNNTSVPIMQNVNVVEDCAICLETPTTGDIIRHLPCLHKFHKDVGIQPFLLLNILCLQKQQT